MKTLSTPNARRRYQSIDAVLNQVGVTVAERRRSLERQANRTLAAELEWLRCSAQLTQAEVARRMGVSQSTVSRIQSSNHHELRLGEILGFLRAVGLRSTQIELRALNSARPMVRLSSAARSL